MLGCIISIDNLLVERCHFLGRSLGLCQNFFYRFLALCIECTTLLCFSNSFLLCLTFFSNLFELLSNLFSLLIGGNCTRVNLFFQIFLRSI